MTLFSWIASRIKLMTLGLSASGILMLSGCYYGGPNHYMPYQNVGNYPAHYSHGKLKPKEKAYLFPHARHVGHPHGGPPGQRKKYCW